jgi:hypothetical protein
VKSRTPAPEGYYEDDADEVADLDRAQLTLRDRLRATGAAVFGTSYGISIAVHVAILLVLATIMIATPPPEAKAELQVSRAIESPKLEERTPDLKDSPEVPLEQPVETPIIILEDEVEISNEVPRCPTLVEGATNKNLEACSVDDAMGLAGGASGAYSGRFKKGRPPEGGGPETDDAVRSALVWLANHQAPDGRWEASSWTQRCKAPACSGPGAAVGGSYDMGVTGLATLAFLGNGNTHRFARNPRFRLVVQRALKWMKSQQRADGSMGLHGSEQEHIYEHAISTMALCEAYAITRDFELKRVAERATAYLIAAQNPGLGWKYGVRSGRNDTSVTGWCVLACKAARVAGLDVPDEVFAGARSWFVRVTDSEGAVGYETPGGGSSYLSPNEGKFDDDPVNTAVGVLGRLLMGERRSEDLIRKGGRIVLGRTPSWPSPAETRGVNFYYWYYGTYAMFQLGGQPWHDWNEKMKAALVPMQRKGGCEGGSWDPVDPWSLAGGRVYATAINALTLEIYYRYDRAKEEPKPR